MKYPVDIEIILKEYSISKSSYIGVAQSYLQNILVRPNSVITDFGSNEHSILYKDIRSIIVGDIPGYNNSFLDFSILDVNWFVYNLDTFGPVLQTESDDNDDGEMVICTQLSLPSISLVNLWENLYYDNNIKQKLLKYAQTMVIFSDKGVDTNVISCNRVILLHGPPGTGKTSLCQALAQKLTIRMSERFTSGILIEINSHSLFSKWFSESGKLVNRMFTKIKEVIENKNILVCVLIDEVESLAHARNQCSSGSEPSDSIRVVNALLTQIDQIKKHSNVLILATSNMTETIDLAFVDRADIKQYLGNPSASAIYKIYHSCINELIKAQIVKGQVLEPIEHVRLGDDAGTLQDTKDLLVLCERSVGLSGRSLRKIPFLAHAVFIESSPVSLSEFLAAMLKAVEAELEERQHFVGYNKKLDPGV